VTATGGIPTGANNGNAANVMAANSINGVITTVTSGTVAGAFADPRTGEDQRIKVTGVGIQTKIGVQPHTTAPLEGKTELGVRSLGNIGIITLPTQSDANGLKDFVLNDRGCLPILALPPAPQDATARSNTAATDSNRAAYTIGRTCTVALDAATGSCAGLATCSFASGVFGCLSGLAGAAFSTITGQNAAPGTSGTAQILTTGTTHIKQQQPTDSFGGVPLQLAYNPIIGPTSAAGAIVQPYFA